MRIVLYFLVLLLIACFDEDNVAGGSDTETMVKTSVINSDESAAEGALLKFVPVGHKPKLEGNDSVIVLETDGNGQFEMDSSLLFSDVEYGLLIQDTTSDESIFIESYDFKNLDTIQLKGSRKIDVRLAYGGAYAEQDSALVYFKGTDIVKLCLGDFKEMGDVPLSLKTVSVHNDTIQESYDIDNDSNYIKISISYDGITYY